MKKTNWTGADCPPTYTVRRNAGLLQLTLYVDVVHTTQGEEGVTADEWSAVRIEMPIGVIDYGSIVSAIIDSHYTNDQMQAIVNNHLIGEHEDVFAEMQEYRTYAKRTAQEIVDDMNDRTEEGKEENNG